MTKRGEEIQGGLISACLRNMQDATLILTRELLSIDIPLEAITVENWRRFDKDRVVIKLWDGEDHIREPSGRTNNLTVKDVARIAKRRQILKRKYNGI